MSNTEIKVGNKLIAEFMGMKHTKTVFDSHGYEQYNYTMPDELSKQVYGFTNAECFLDDQFSKSWDWLMPVVEKIEKGGDHRGQIVGVTINFSACSINSLHDDIVVTGERKIESVWQACVQFIKWYNTQKQSS